MVGDSGRHRSRPTEEEQPAAAPALPRVPAGAGELRRSLAPDRCRDQRARRGIPYPDPLPALRADWQAKEEKLFYDHCPPYTPYGYTVVARDILADLDREKLISR